MVCHIGGQLGTKVGISALGMLALYMCFNGTGIWGGETLTTSSSALISRDTLLIYLFTLQQIYKDYTKYPM